LLFNSLTFLVFFLIILIMYNFPLEWKIRKSNLLIASYFFYGVWNPPFVLLLWLSTIVDWFVAKKIYQAKQRYIAKLLLLMSLAINIGVLSFFKYGIFFLDIFSSFMDTFGLSFQPPTWDIILPVGISFYTFQSLSYTFDIYYKKQKPCNSFLDFALFVTFFPQLVAGPIVKARQLIPQFTTPKFSTLKNLYWGTIFMTLGLFQKIILADMLLGPTANIVFSHPESISRMEAWLGVLAFSGQILSDFAGYTTTAIGIALCLGFKLPKNFNYPYAAIGFSDFWRRWHISLSSWLKEYLYFPLGGNRKNQVRTLINLMLTMLIGGLWHGANWTFVIWGALHGFYLIMEKILLFATPEEIRKIKSLRIATGILTFILVLIAWVFFRSPDITSAITLIDSMFGANSQAVPILNSMNIAFTIVTMILMLAFHSYMRNRELIVIISNAPIWLISIIWSLLIAIIIFSQGSNDAFIYFQF